MELLSTDIAATSLQIGEGGRVYHAKDGVVNVENPKHIKMLRQLGCTSHAYQPTGGRTFVCPACGFRAFFRDKCGRCGQTDLPEGD